MRTIGLARTFSESSRPSSAAKFRSRKPRWRSWTAASSRKAAIASSASGPPRRVSNPRSTSACAISPRSALQQRGREADDAVAEARRQVLGEPEVEQHQARLAVGAALHQDVARVRIGVEEAVAEDLLAVGLGQQLRHLVGVESGCAQARHVRDLDAVDELHHEHAARGQLPVDARHATSSRPANMRATVSALWPSFTKLSSRGT